MTCKKGNKPNYVDGEDPWLDEFSLASITREMGSAQA